LENRKALARDDVADVYCASSYRYSQELPSHKTKFSWVQLSLAAIASGIAVGAASIIFADTAYADDQKYAAWNHDIFYISYIV
jgi:hypothetical protein